MLLLLRKNAWECVKVTPEINQKAGESDSDYATRFDTLIKRNTKIEEMYSRDRGLIIEQTTLTIAN
jgi:hypothetical protein